MQTQNLEKNENVFVEKGFKEQKINEMKKKKQKYLVLEMRRVNNIDPRM